MTILGIILLALGGWTNWDNTDHQLSQAVNGCIVMIIGAVMIVLGETSWLDFIFFRR